MDTLLSDKDIRSRLQPYLAVLGDPAELISMMNLSDHPSSSRSSDSLHQVALVARSYPDARVKLSAMSLISCNLLIKKLAEKNKPTHSAIAWVVMFECVGNFIPVTYIQVAHKLAAEGVPPWFAGKCLERGLRNPTVIIAGWKEMIDLDTLGVIENSVGESC